MKIYTVRFKDTEYSTTLSISHNQRLMLEDEEGLTCWPINIAPDGELANFAFDQTAPMSHWHVYARAMLHDALLGKKICEECPFSPFQINFLLRDWAILLQDTCSNPRKSPVEDRTWQTGNGEPNVLWVLAMLQSIKDADPEDVDFTPVHSNGAVDITKLVASISLSSDLYSPEREIPDVDHGVWKSALIAARIYFSKMVDAFLTNEFHESDWILPDVLPVRILNNPIGDWRAHEGFSGGIYGGNAT